MSIGVLPTSTLAGRFFLCERVAESRAPVKTQHRNETPDWLNTPAQQERRTQTHGLLLAWYSRYGRHTLPWRHTRDPYAILVSEVMLQQTQVERVLPKYQAFLARFPTLAALAEAPTSEVIKAWAGLGYNMRAVRLQQIAQEAIARYAGALPNTLDGLLSLKGVGRYTAGAIACFAFDQPVATVDTNIRRVLWRVFRGIEPIVWPAGVSGEREALALAAWALPGRNTDQARVEVATQPSSQSEQSDAAQAAYDWQQALMDLGATVCQSRRPACEQCPLTEVCAAYAEVAALTLFPSGEALARLRDERAALSEHPEHTGASEHPQPQMGQVAETRAASTSDANTTRETPEIDGNSRPTATVAKPRKATQPFTSTTRYFRGRIIATLSELAAGESLALAELGLLVKPNFSPDDLPWLRGLVDGLARDGLVRWLTGKQDDAAEEARVALP